MARLRCLPYPFDKLVESSNYILVDQVSRHEQSYGQSLPGPEESN